MNRNIISIADAMNEDHLPAEAEPRSIDAITKDILHNKERAGNAMLEIGRGLIEAKELLPHGEWIPWLRNEVNFSERTAQVYMQVASLPNAQPVADLGMRKAQAIVALDLSEYDSFLSETHVVNGEEKTVIDMSTRELKQAIQERKAALEAKEAAEADKRAAEAAQAKMAQDMVFANERLETLTAEATTQGGTVERLRAELEALRAQPVDMTVSSVAADSALEEARRAGAEEAAKTARQEAEAKLKEKLDKAAKAKSDAEAALKATQADRDALQARATALEKQAKVSGSKELALLSVCYESEQETFNRILGVLKKIELAGNADAYNGSVNALHALFSALDARVPDQLEVRAL